MNNYYKLNGKIAVLCDSISEWGIRYETDDRVVANENIAGIRISTVFLGIDHSSDKADDPLLFETMVFLPNGDAGRMRRYFTWEEAEQGHKEIADLVRAEAIIADLDAADIISQIMLKMTCGK